MPAKTAAQIEQAIEQGTLEPVYYVAGEAYPCERFLSGVRRAFLGEKAHDDLAVETLRGGQDSARAILTAMNSGSLFAPRRLIIVRDSHLFKAQDLTELLPTLAQENPAVCLVFVGEKADGKMKFVKQLKEQGRLCLYEPLKERTAPGWLMQEAKRHKIALASGAAQRIVAAVGINMSELVMALERLSLYAAGRAVNPEDVERCLAQTRERSVFELTTAFGDRDRARALEIVSELMAQRAPALRLLAMLSRQLRLLWQAKELADARVKSGQMASQLGVPPFAVEHLVRQGRRIDHARFFDMHRAITEADRAFKGGGLSDSAVMDRLIFRLCPVATQG